MNKIVVCRLSGPVILSTIRATICYGCSNAANGFRLDLPGFVQRRFEPIAEVNGFEIETMEIAKGQAHILLGIHTEPFASFVFS